MQTKTYANLTDNEKKAVESARGLALYIMQKNNLMTKPMSEWSRDEVNEFLTLVCHQHYGVLSWENDIPF